MTELRPIGKRASIKELIIDLKTKSWIFESKLEKLIITGAVAWSFYSLIKFLWQLIT